MPPFLGFTGRPLTGTGCLECLLSTGLQINQSLPNLHVFIALNPVSFLCIVVASLYLIQMKGSGVGVNLIEITFASENLAVYYAEV